MLEGLRPVDNAGLSARSVPRTPALFKDVRYASMRGLLQEVNIILVLCCTHCESGC